MTKEEARSLCSIISVNTDMAYNMEFSTWHQDYYVTVWKDCLGEVVDVFFCYSHEDYHRAIKEGQIK